MDAVMKKKGRRGKCVARRVPRPMDPINQRMELERAEHKALEEAAHRCGVSVASLVRLVLVESARAVLADEGEVRKAVLLAIADEITRAAEAANKPKPGRQKKPRDE